MTSTPSLAGLGYNAQLDATIAVLRADVGRWWTAQMLADRLGFSRSRASDIFADLTSQGWVDRQKAGRSNAHRWACAGAIR